MQSTQKPLARRRRFYASPRVLCILGFVLTYIVVLTAWAPQASASAPGGNVTDPVVRRVDIARPAVVRIITQLGGQLTVHFNATVTTTFPLSGGSYTLESSGSGAFISPHGEILTADHVVHPPHDQGLDSALYIQAAEDVANFINSHFQVPVPYSANDAYNLLVSGSLPSSTSYTQPTSQVFLSTSYAGTLNANKLETIPAGDHASVDRVEASSDVNASDVAIVHVSGMDNMPSIQLGDSSKVAELDNLTIIGYPGLGDLSQGATDLLTSSVNRIYVSALKTTDGGISVIQVGGNVEHGDSGGPALDDSGHIVGIVSFGFSGLNGDYGQTAFLQASNSALALIKQQGINTAPGSFELAWEQAMNDYASASTGHWQTAAQELQTLASSYPHFQGITSYLNYAKTQATQEGAPLGAASGVSTVLLSIVLIVLLLGALLIFFVIFLRRKAAVAMVGPGGAQYAPNSYGAHQPLQAGFYPLHSASASASTPYLQPVAGGSGASQPLLFTPVHQNYTLPSAYGPLPGLVPQTPLPVMDIPGPVPQTPLPVVGAFPLASVYASLPGEDAGVSSNHPGIADIATRETHAVAPAPSRLSSGDSWPVYAEAPEAVAPASALTLSDDKKVMQASEPAQFASSAPTDEPAKEQTIVAQASAEETSAVQTPVEEAPSRIPAEDATISQAPIEAATVTSSVPDPSPRTSPCGHVNPPDVRFCRVCGQPAAQAVSPAPEPGSSSD